MTVERLQDLFKNGNKAQTIGRPKAMNTDFGGMLDAVSAMGPTVGTAASIYGAGGTSQAVLAAAFSGVSAGSAAGAASGGMSMTSAPGGDYINSVPSFAGGYSGQTVSSTGTLGGLDANAAAVPGTEGFSQMDLINTMNQNNLKLMELQAVMQSHMQTFNTKSNILNADHRARMAIIEKFNVR